MALLDKVSGELQLYIGGFVTPISNFDLAVKRHTIFT